MSYETLYNEQASGVNYQSIQQILNILVSWEMASAQEDYDNIYRSVLFDAQNGAARVTLAVENIPDGTGPTTAHTSLQAAVDDINGSLGTTLPDAADAAQVR